MLETCGHFVGSFHTGWKGEPFSCPAYSLAWTLTSSIQLTVTLPDQMLAWINRLLPRQRP